MRAKFAQSLSKHLRLCLRNGNEIAADRGDFPHVRRAVDEQSRTSRTFCCLSSDEGRLDGELVATTVKEITL